VGGVIYLRLGRGAHLYRRRMLCVPRLGRTQSLSRTVRRTGLRLPGGFGPSQYLLLARRAKCGVTLACLSSHRAEIVRRLRRLGWTWDSRTTCRVSARPSHVHYLPHLFRLPFNQSILNVTYLKQLYSRPEVPVSPENSHRKKVPETSRFVRKVKLSILTSPF